MAKFVPKKTWIFIDSCTWDVFFEFRLNLLEVFPSDEFQIMMTKEVRDFEIEAIPANAEKIALIEYIQGQIRVGEVLTDAYFGFAEDQSPSSYRPRVEGFGKGRWITDEEGRFFEYFKSEAANAKDNGLYKNEADASLAVRACTVGIVITAEKRKNGGPLKKAAALGAAIVFLKEWDRASMLLQEYLRNEVKRFQGTKVPLSRLVVGS